MRSDTWIKNTGGCLALGMLVLILPEAYERNTYFDLNCGLMERRVEASGCVFRCEPVDSPVADLYERYVGPLPAGREWKLCFSVGCNIYGGTVIKSSPCYDDLPDLNYILPRWFDDTNYPNGQGINYTGITEAAKREMLLRTLDAARRMGRGDGSRKYLDRVQRSVAWLDHPADVADLPTVSEALDDKIWKAVWELRIEELEATNRTRLEAL